MKAVIQRASYANVKVDGDVVGEIRKGLVILLGVEDGDTEKDANALADKIYGMRIFCDDNDKINLSLSDVDGDVLVISNFTLCADCSHGRRPYFGSAAGPDNANMLYEHFCKEMKSKGVNKVEKGIFGADMKLELLNDGPVTIITEARDGRVL